MISLIVAMDRNRVIGVDNKLPWHLPADLKRFKALTSGHHIIMGRKTFESIGRALPGRTNVIITRQDGFKAEGCTVVHSLEAAMMTSQGDDEAFIIGGGDLFAQALSFADKIYITEIDTVVEGGMRASRVFFPQLNPQLWCLAEKVECQPDNKNSFLYAYLTYVKKA